MYVPPAHLWIPDAAASTAGGEAADFASSIGITLDPEQKTALDAILAEKSDGRWAAFEAGVVAARQNLKTFLFLVIAFSDVYIFGSTLVTWTAHEFNTAMASFQDVKDLIETYPHLSRYVSRISNANGEEGIEFRFPDGRRELRFKARTKSGGRGLTGDRVILDEAFALQPAHMGSLMPTLSAKSVTGNPQILYGSSAGKVDSAVLRSVRDRGRAGNDPTLVYIEWCAPTGGCAQQDCNHVFGSVGCVLDDPERWRLANPAMGRRVSEEWIAGERRSLPPEEFARERLGWWDDPAGLVGALPPHVWAGCLDADSEIKTVKALAFDVAPDSSWAAISVSGLRSDGRTHIETVDYKPGTAWLAARSGQLVEKYGLGGVFFDEKGPGSAVVPEFEAKKITVWPITPAQMPTACGALVKNMLNGRVRQIGQPELDRAVAQAVRRMVGDSWVWSRRQSPVDITPVTSATFAAWGADNPQSGKPVFAF